MFSCCGGRPQKYPRRRSSFDSYDDRPYRRRPLPVPDYRPLPLQPLPLPRPALLPLEPTEPYIQPDLLRPPEPLSVTPWGPPRSRLPLPRLRTEPDILQAPQLINRPLRVPVPVQNPVNVRCHHPRRRRFSLPQLPPPQNIHINVPPQPSPQPPPPPPQHIHLRASPRQPQRIYTRSPSPPPQYTQVLPLPTPIYKSPSPKQRHLPIMPPRLNQSEVGDLANRLLRSNVLARNADEAADENVLRIWNLFVQLANSTISSIMPYAEVHPKISLTTGKYPDDFKKPTTIRQLLNTPDDTLGSILVTYGLPNPMPVLTGVTARHAREVKADNWRPRIKDLLQFLGIVYDRSHGGGQGLYGQLEA